MSTAIDKVREGKQMNPITNLKDRQMTLMHMEHEVRKIRCHSSYLYYYYFNCLIALSPIVFSLLFKCHLK